MERMVYSARDLKLSTDRTPGEVFISAEGCHAETIFHFSLSAEKETNLDLRDT